MKIIDMHCDTILELLERKRNGRPYALRSCDTQIDLDKMKKATIWYRTLPFLLTWLPLTTHLRRHSA
ncbi:MAG: hypothetical protein V8R80_12400 [Eubacterium sp.]